VDLADRDELVEVERALNEMAMCIAIQSRRQAAQHAATRMLAESETLGPRDASHPEGHLRKPWLAVVGPVDHRPREGGPAVR
jgi:hypothetical protein